MRETAPISLLSIEVYQDTSLYTPFIYKTTFDYENLLVEQGTISNGTLTHSTGNGTFWHGPYASLPKGEYMAKFWLKLDKPYNGTLLRP